ncbi:Coenzyme F390 synthetase [marine gamma proteobacterium HTCC2143]|uniref:Coenzyme F390 synthetase n=1 Tax=marine gamma proteobacterium HTCC2143 TaxID=247633 RepID=A0YGH3_9GAMM|nr:Coenzyme F390 synthetase [marine gamma proteobacterium HTCC2143]
MSANRLEAIYNALPVVLQNLLVSIKGFQLQKVRKSGNYSSYRRIISERSHWSQQQFLDYQLEQLQAVVGYARDNTTHFYRLCDELGLNYAFINSLDDIRRLPVLRRHEITQNHNDFIAHSVSEKQRYAVHTTGTTGSPLKVTCDSDARQKNYAFFDQYLDSIGIDSDSRHIIIGGRILMPPDSNKPPFWRYSVFQKSLLMSSYHLSDQYIAFYVEKIADFKPTYIESYPSSIYRIAQFMNERDICVPCKAIITSAETLLREQRSAIEHAFSCPIFDQYGCAEMSVFSAQCKKGAYHVRPDYGLLEILDDNDEPLPRGEKGNVVCTSFINRAMPLIRYNLGDISAFGPHCDCGLNTPTLIGIEGRKDDVIYTADRKAVGRLSPVLKGLPVVAVQYIQNQVGFLQVLIEPACEFGEKSLSDIDVSLRSRIGEKMQVEYKIVDTIPRGRGGKLKSVISTIGKPNLSP